MELEFSDEQDALREGVRAILDRECPMSLVRAIVEGGASADALWKQMVALGWPGLTIAEEHGGLGFGPVELAVVVEELGHVVAPGPFVPTVCLFAPVVRELGTTEQRARFLGGIAVGGITGTCALVEHGGFPDPAAVHLTATPDGTDWSLHGTKQAVLGADDVDEIIIVARLDDTTDDEGVAAFVVPRDDVEVVPVRALDPTRSLATLVLDGVTISTERLLGAPGPATAHGVRRAAEEATTALALEAVGTCQAIFDVTLEYAKHRQQFGVPIGSFQAIKHKFANMLIALERARATAYFAALTIAEDDDRRSLAVSTAKVAAGDCQRLLAKEGIQIHGGIGYTWEHDMHLYVRRVKTDAQLLGTDADHRVRIAELLGL